MHQSLFTMDSHIDTPIRLSFPGFDIRKSYNWSEYATSVDLSRLRKGGLDAGFWAIYSRQGPLTTEGYDVSYINAKRRLAQIQNMVKSNPDSLVLAKSTEEINRLSGDSRHIIVLSMENAYPLGNDLTKLNEFYKKGLRMLGLVHVTNNQFADSSTDKKGEKWGGLSPLGKELVKRANDLGIILDGSHASDKAVLQLIELSRAPIVLSHSGVKSIFEHPRNVDDNLLRELAQKGGVIQMNAYPSYLRKIVYSKDRLEARRTFFDKMYAMEDNNQPISFQEFSSILKEIDKQYPPQDAYFQDYMNHFDHALKIIGPYHVGVGADWDGGGGVKGMRDVSMIPKITDYLATAGWGEKDLQQIWGANLLRVMRKVETLSDR